MLSITVPGTLPTCYDIVVLSYTATVKVKPLRDEPTSEEIIET